MSHDSAEHGIHMSGEIDWDEDETPVHDHPDDQLCHVACPAWEYHGRDANPEKS